MIVKGRKEDAFIFNAARLHLEEQNINALNELAASSLDWQAVASKAEAHGVNHFLYYALKRHGLHELLPKEIFDRFKISYYENAVRNAGLINEFKKIADMLPNRIIPLKGIELIQSLYPNIAIRSMCDIDLLVAQEHAEGNWNMLCDRGLKVLPDHVPVKSAVHNERMWEEAAGHLRTLRSDRAAVEVHWSMFREKKFDWINRKALEKAVHIENNVFRLPHEIMLMHLCLHVYRHTGNVILRAFCDINEFVLKYQHSLDWREIEEICSDPSLKHELDAVLTCTHILLGTPIPDNFLARQVLRQQEIIRSFFLQKGILQEVLRPGQREKMRRFFYDVHSITNLSDKAIFVFRTFVPTKEWMRKAEFDVSTGLGTAVAYPRYWVHLAIRSVWQKRGLRKFKPEANKR